MRRLALLLFGREDAIRRHLPTHEVAWQVLDDERVLENEIHRRPLLRSFDELAPRAADYLQGRDISIVVNLGAGGSHTATVWTCDLSAEYVKINAEYRT